MSILKISDSPFHHDLPGGVRIGLFNVTDELPRLLSELTKRLFFLSVHNEVWWDAIPFIHQGYAMVRILFLLHGI